MTYKEYLEKIRQGLLAEINRTYDEMIRDEKDVATKIHLGNEKLHHIKDAKDATEISQLIVVMQGYGYDVASVMASLVHEALNENERKHFQAEKTWIPLRGWDT